MGYKRDVNSIHVYIDLDDKANNTLFSRVEIHKRVSKEAKKILSKYGVDYEILDLGGKGGGGGLDILWENLKNAWAHRDVILLVIRAIPFIWSCIMVVARMIRNHDSVKPRVNISLSIETFTDWEDKNLSATLGKRLINLKHLNDEICSVLKRKFPVFEYDQSYSLFVQPRQFQATFYIPSECLNTFSKFRIINIFKYLRIKNNTSSLYKLNKVFVVRRGSHLQTDGHFNIRSGTSKTYYLLISTNVINDYFS